MELCKYCDKTGINILKHKALKLSSIDDFNDPFEFKIAKTNNDILNSSLKNVYESQRNRYRVLCFTSNDNNIIMWSHYSNNHSGILIKFQTDKLIVNNLVISESIEAVEYKEDMIKLPADFSNLDWENQSALIKRNTYRKFIDWNYEKEYRAIFLFDHSENKRYIEISNEAIVEVTLGYKCALQTELDCISILKTSEYKHVKLKRAIMDDYNYKMQYCDVNI